MNKEDAQKELIKLIAECNRKCEAYYKKHPPHGLDGPVPDEIRKIDQETKKKIKELKASVDE